MVGNRERKFQRRIEDFTCDKCGFFVEGNGYTNHCPKCLWSRHVDINPGDRLATCKGMMEPVSVEKGSEGFDIIHRCVLCGKIQKNKVSKEDNFEKIIDVSKNISPK